MGNFGMETPVKNPLNCEGLQHPPCCRHCSVHLDLCRLLDGLRKRTVKFKHEQRFELHSCPSRLSFMVVGWKDNREVQT